MNIPLIAVATAGIFTGITVSNQAVAPGPDKGGHALGRIKHGCQSLMADLGLTESQKSEIERIKEDAKVQAKRHLAGGEANGQSLRSLHESVRERIAGVLTQQQRAKLESRKAEMKAQFEARRAEREAAFAKELGLSQDQVSKIRAIKEDVKAQMRAMKDGTQTLDREAFRTLHDQARERIRGVLDTEQRAKFDQMKDKFKSRRKGTRPGSVPPVKTTALI